MKRPVLQKKQECSANVPAKLMPRPVMNNTSGSIADIVNASKFSSDSSDSPGLKIGDLSDSLYGLNNSSSDDDSGTVITPATDKSMVTLTPDELEQIAAEKASAMLSEYTKELEAKAAEIEANSRRSVEDLQLKLRQAQQDAVASDAEASRLQAIFKVSGYANPGTKPVGATLGARTPAASPYSGIGFNITGRPSQHPLGSALDYVNLLDSSQYTPKVIRTGNDGEQYEFVDESSLTQFYRKNSAYLKQDMENFARGNGLLNGGITQNPSSNSSVAGTTSITTIPDAFLSYLSMEMRETHSPQFIWHQFTSNKYEIGLVPGTVALVPRFAYFDEAISEDDYTLDTTEYSQPISAENQALQLLTSPLTLKGYGLGKGNRNGTRPVAVPEFINASSMADLAAAVNTRLWQNYCSFEDVSIRRKYFEVSDLNPNSVYYNQSGLAVNDPTTIGVGGDGTLSEDFLHSIFSTMANQNMLMFENGDYGLCVTPNQANQLRRSLDSKEQVYSEAQLSEITSILKMASIGTGQVKPTGFIGRYAGFMIFSGTSWGQGMSPNNNGVRSIAFNNSVGNQIVRSAYAFGMGAVGRGISMPFQIRQDGSGQFGTKMRFIWRSIESFGSLDVADNGTNGQQNRVLELRTVDQSV